ncbi:MAG: T9SS type A sorting domain-containing protein [Microscillaceae bacterium]|nr:T9SS type A sorting domain-containing protein [Microscillaceae bacterium]
MKRFYILILLCTLFTDLSQAQCTITPGASGICAGGNGAVGNGQNINTGQTYWHAGSSTNFPNVSLNGGTLRICGTAQLSDFNFNSGNLIIEAGGELVISGGGQLNLNGNCRITNYGILTIARNMSMQNANNFLFNANTGVLNMVGQELELNSNSSPFINQGEATIGTLRIQSNNGGVCLSPTSSLSVSTLINNASNPVQVNPVGGAMGCISFSGNAQLNQPLTASPDLVICQASGATISGPSNFGTAAVNQNCGDCASLSLPVTFSHFAIQQAGDQVQLEWHTASEQNSAFFRVEHSSDGLVFSPISPEIAAAGQSNRERQYDWTDTGPLPGLNYYRISQTDRDGSQQWTGVKAILIDKQVKVRIFPNPAVACLYITNLPPQTQEVVLLNMQGQTLQKSTEFSSETLKWSTAHLKPGLYLIKWRANGQSGQEKIVIE